MGQTFKKQTSNEELREDTHNENERKFVNERWE